MDKSLILNKIKEYLKIKTDKEFASFLGINETTFAMWKKRNIFDIELVFKKCEYLNAEWLLTGEGEMLKNKTFEPVEAKSNDKYIALLEENIKTLKSQIKDKEEKEALYKEKIRSLEEKSMNEKNSAVYPTKRSASLKL